MSRMLLALSVLSAAFAGGAFGHVLAAEAVPLEREPALGTRVAPTSTEVAPTPAPGFELVVTLLNATGTSTDALVELWREDPREFVRHSAEDDGRLLPPRLTWPRWTAPVAGWSPFRVVVPGTLDARDNRARLSFHELPHETALWIEVRPAEADAFERHVIELAPVSPTRARHDLAVGLRTAGGVRARFDDSGAAPLEAAWIARAGAPAAVSATRDGSLRLALDSSGETDVELLACAGGALYRALRTVDIHEGSWSDAGRVPLLELPPRLTGRVVGEGTLRVLAADAELAHLEQFGADGAFVLHGDWPARLELLFEPADGRRFDPVRRDAVIGDLDAVVLEPTLRTRPRVRVLAHPFHARYGGLRGELTWTLEREGAGVPYAPRPLRLQPAEVEDAASAAVDLGELEQGLWILKLWDPGRGLGAVRRFAVPPTDGGQRELGVELTDPVVRLRGVVRLEEDGELRRGDLVYVGLRPEDARRAGTVDEADGTAFDSGYFELAGLVPGETYVLHWFDARDGRLLATRAYDLPPDSDLDVGTVTLER